MSVTQERPVVKARVEREHSMRWWIVAVIGVCALAIGVLIGSMLDGGDEADTTVATTTTEATITTALSSVPPASVGITVLIEDYLASWETKDEQALRALVADDFVIDEYIYSAGTGDLYELIDDDADGIVSEGFGFDWQNEIIGDSVVSGNGPWLVRHREAWQQQASRYDGIATYNVVDDGGTLKIARHSWAGFIWTEF